MLKVLVPSIAVLELQIVFEESPQSQWVLCARYLSTSGLLWNSGDLLKAARRTDVRSLKTRPKQSGTMFSLADKLADSKRAYRWQSNLHPIKALEMIRNQSLTLGIYASLFLLNLHQSILALAQDPAMTIATGDHDDRVVPGHSYKFAARLQSCQSGTRPTWIRIETSAGHGAGTPVSKLIDTAADTLAFVWKNFGLE